MEHTMTRIFAQAASLVLAAAVTGATFAGSNALAKAQYVAAARVATAAVQSTSPRTVVAVDR
jgi:hypothetical protein